jgi:hypothetical protein
MRGHLSSPFAAKGTFDTITTQKSSIAVGVCGKPVDGFPFGLTDENASLGVDRSALGKIE